jgi:hypothetical protein
MVYDNGTLMYSPIITLNSRIVEKITVVYDGSGQIRLNTPYAIRQINLLNSQGQKVKIFTNVQSGSQVLQAGNLPPGIYWLQCVGEKVENYKIGVF